MAENPDQISEASRLSPRGRVRIPNFNLDQEGILKEDLNRLRNSRRGVLSAITVKQNGIVNLLTDDKNLEVVKAKLRDLEELFLKYVDVHYSYQRLLPDVESQETAQHQYEKKEKVRRNFIISIQEWVQVVESRTPHIADIHPEDSVSDVGSKASSRRLIRPSSVTSRDGSRISSASASRVKEATRRAELIAQAECLEQQQALEQQKFRIQQEEKRMQLETEIAKSVAKENVWAALEENERSKIIQPVRTNIQSRLSKTKVNSQAKSQPSESNKSSRSESSGYGITTLQTMLRLQGQQNDLNLKQNEILKGFSAQQERSSLPKPQITIFAGNPMEYQNFERAFENIIETRIANDTERLYYLEQYTAGEVKELVKSCQHMKPERGYREARRLLKKNYGNEYKISAAYMEKLARWPDLKSVATAALHKLSIFLLCCKNVMTTNAYLNKFESADSLQQVVQKLPFSMRCRWRRQADEIIEVKQRLVTFPDLVDFVEKEARIANNPIFGNISERPKAWPAKGKSNEVSKSRQANPGSPLRCREREEQIILHHERWTSHVKN